MHFEVGGIAAHFQDVQPHHRPARLRARRSTKAGGGGEVNGNFEVAKNFRLITNNQFGDGIGRYFFGNAPDVVVRADGSLSPIHTFSTVDGFEATVQEHPAVLLFRRYLHRQERGGGYQRHSLVGWGYTGSSNGQNRSVNEYTFGFNQTLWKSAAYGAVNIMGQYEYATRTPWYVATGALESRQRQHGLFRSSVYPARRCRRR